MPLFYHCTLFSQEVYYIIERCEVNKTFIQPSGALYQDYREYSKSIGEPPRSNASFNKALAEKGFKKQKNGRGSFIYGLRLLDEAPACQIPFISASQVMGSDGENQESDDSEIEF
jgi:phage/plasmid-associated DNA primase